MRCGSQEMAIVGPDFAEARLDGGNYMDRVAGTQKNLMR